MGDYVGILKEHLSAYKRKRLGVEEDGVWSGNGKAYPYILPESLWRLNIVETYREEFCDFLSGSGFSLHSPHHLNSSQMMCFNLFYPLIYEHVVLPLLPAALNIPLAEEEAVDEVCFEKVLDAREYTHFDFYLRLSTGRQFLFECKYTEESFGGAEVNDRRMKKLHEVYRPRLQGVVDESCLEPMFFFRNYQLMRNVSYLNEASQDHLIVVAPEGLHELRGELDGFLDIVVDSVRERIHFLSLDQLVVNLCRLTDRGFERMRVHFEMFREKYLLKGEEYGS